MKISFQRIVLIALLFIEVCHSVIAQTNQKENSDKISLGGNWLLQIDSLDKGEAEKWYNRTLVDNLRLPGSLTTNGKGNNITVNTPWTGSIVDSSWFFQSHYAPFREPGNIKVPFWLQPIKYYKGAAWYQKTVNIPSSWKGKHLELFIERSHWETVVWVDGQKIGLQNSLSTAHVFDLSKALTPGLHRLTIRIDNRIKDFNIGQNSHSITDHTQTNWNGMVGELYLKARPAVYIENIQLYPNIRTKEVVAVIKLKNTTGQMVQSSVELMVTSDNPKAEKLKLQRQGVKIAGDSVTVQVTYSMGNSPLLWNEFTPNLYTLTVRLRTSNNGEENEGVIFGMREFATKGTYFTINGQLTFLRGTLECAVFPLTGFPATDVLSWMHIFQKAKSYGLNHMRFHSWCPPEAAFEAADRSGFYLQIECSSWANQGAVIGDGQPLDQYIYEESESIVKAYGNHPSFCMMAYGNEPAGRNHKNYLTAFVNYWRKKDPRRLYTTAAGWPVVAENDYNSTPEPRIQAWGEGLKSIINSQPPKTNYDWSSIIAKWQHPTVSHEIGQWCVYPDFKEIKKYKGVLKAKNFEIFQHDLNEHGMSHLADSFLLASGKLQALCYKADIEAALRTPGFCGFQLLGLYDFPGQGTALVGVLDPFWEDKGYITAKEYSRFCNATVPLARFPKMVYLNNEQLSVPIEVANFDAAILPNVVPKWLIKNDAGRILFQGQLPQRTIGLGNAISLGEIRQSLNSIDQPSALTLSVSIGAKENTWEFFVYPASLPGTGENIHVIQQFDDEAIQKLNDGGRVLLTLKKGAVKSEKGGKVAVGFSSIFWNTAWTNDQAPHTLGILCSPKHPALKEFPTAYYSNWQWWDAMSHSDAVVLDSIARNLRPIVRVIDDWVTAQPLGLIFECRVGKGKLIVSSIDLLTNQEQRPEARQLLYSLKKYMSSNQFQPGISVSAEKIKSLTN